MNKRLHTGDDSHHGSAHRTDVVDLADARARLRTPRGGSRASHEEIESELEEIRLLLDQGITTEVKSRLNSLMSSARHDPSALARARCLLSAALETEGHYRESLEAVEMYESTESRAKLDAQTRADL